MCGPFLDVFLGFFKARWKRSHIQGHRLCTVGTVCCSLLLRSNKSPTDGLVLLSYSVILLKKKRNVRFKCRGRLVGRLVGRSVGWLVGPLVCWLVVSLVGRSVGGAGWAGLHISLGIFRKKLGCFYTVVWSSNMDIAARSIHRHEHLKHPIYRGVVVLLANDPFRRI